jgi:RNA polymerase sigma factor (sigma-70 family)
MTPAGRFETTRWTLIVKAGQRTPSAESAHAMARLCELYWPPLYGYARRRGKSVEDAQDLTQAFFARFLEKRDIEGADPIRGRFRSFLLASFKHFIANEYDRQRARKRGGDQVVLSLDFDTAESQYVAEPPDLLTPEALFERHWARGLLTRALAALEAEARASEKLTLFEAVKSALTGEKEESHAALAAKLGMTAGAIRVTIHRLRRRLRELLRAEIAATVDDDAEIDEEIRFLTSVLADSAQNRM